MAMSKVERAEMEALRTRLALSWPPPPPKPVDLEVAREATGGGFLHLWWANPHRPAVGRGVTNGNNHSVTDYTDEQIKNRYGSSSRVSMSQGGGGPWYASEVDAYRALHYAVAQQCAERLRQVEVCMEAAALNE